MNRRTLLKRGGVGVAVLVGLSGCTEETLEEAETKPPFLDVNDEELELPVTRAVDVVEEGILQADGAEIEDIDGFEAYLEEQELPVEDLSEAEKVVEEKLDVEREDVDVIEEEAHGEETVLELEYVQPERIETGALHAIGLVAGGYAALVTAGYDAELLEATILDSDLESFGAFDVLTAWAEEYNDGITSARTYGDKAWMATSSE